MTQATNVTPICRVCGLPIGNPACTVCGSGGPAMTNEAAESIYALLRHCGVIVTEEMEQEIPKIIGDLAPRLTPEELEAKIHAVVVNKRENENWGNAIRREFNVVTCGDGVDWKAKYQSAKEELEESEHARHLQIEELASVHSEIEAAERERDEAIKQRDEWIRLSIRDSTERDALAARVRELEATGASSDAVELANLRLLFRTAKLEARNG